MMQPYDIVGDIHGHADELEALLRRLGYLEIAGRYRHPGGRKSHLSRRLSRLRFENSSRASDSACHGGYPVNWFLIRGDSARTHPETPGRNPAEEHRNASRQHEREVRATRGLLPDIHGG